MEFAIDQALKIYSGGLGFLAGSHMRGAYELGQNLIGIGVLWKYGIMIRLAIRIRPCRYNGTKRCTIFGRHRHPLSDQHPQCPVWVAAYYLPPHVFQSAPVFIVDRLAGE